MPAGVAPASPIRLRAAKRADACPDPVQKQRFLRQALGAAEHRGACFAVVPAAARPALVLAIQPEGQPQEERPEEECHQEEQRPEEEERHRRREACHQAD